MSFLSEVLVFLLAALVVVPLLKRLGLSSVIGYLVAGVLIGPSALGLVQDPENILHFAEIGVVLLLFIIGLELQPRRLWVMRRIVFGLGSAQVLASAIVIAGLLLLVLRLPFGVAALLGFALALSSTAFVLQLLGEDKQLNHRHGRAAFGILLLQDIAVIPAVAALTILGSEDEGAIDPLVIGAVIAGLIAARFLLVPLLRIVAASGIHELFIAAGLSIVIGAALAMYSAGLSMGLGAFIAGMLVADSEYRHQLETDIMPFKSLLLGLFFIAVGMSANLGLLVDSPLIIVAATLALILVKTLTLIPIGFAFGLDRDDAIRVSVLLSQGGEFAFVLLTIAAGSNLIGQSQMEMVILVVTLSMAATPFAARLTERWLSAGSDDRPFDDISETATPVIIAGFGRFGQMFGRILTMNNIPFTALDANPGQVDFVRDFGNEVYYGDATRLDLLQTAHVQQATALVIAMDDMEASVRLASTMRETCPNLILLARARNRQHEIRLREVGVHFVIRETLLSSLALVQSLLEALGYTGEAAEQAVQMFKDHDQKTIAKQAAVAHDDKGFKQTAIDAAEELKQLFLDDRRD